jgi:hypothetical protein
MKADHKVAMDSARTRIGLLNRLIVAYDDGTHTNGNGKGKKKSPRFECPKRGCHVMITDRGKLRHDNYAHPKS